MSSLGLAAAARQLRGSELGHIAEIALVAYVVGAVLWMIELAFRMSVMVAAAVDTVRTGTVPVWIAPLAMWGAGLFIGYAVLSNIAGLGFGAAPLRADLVPAWAGWTAVGMSVLLLGPLPITLDNIPAMNLIAPVVIGVALLLPRA